MTKQELNQLKEEFRRAKKELGEHEFNCRYREVFGIPCLDFVDSVVINLPEPCYANCDYCIDSYLRKSSIDTKTFLQICEEVLKTFPKTNKVAITGGSLNADDFNYLLTMIKSYLPDSYINWNTNGVLLDDTYLSGIQHINHVNLHRNSINEEENRCIFRTTKPIISIKEAKELIKDKLCLRVTIDKTFNLDEYSKAEVPLYLNRLLPGTEETDKVFEDTLEKLNISTDIDRRRRNVYLTAFYNDVPVRICMGDKLSTHIPNRLPTYLNVAIIHRSGVVCGSWFEDDKVIYNPNNKTDSKKLSLNRNNTI